ncbi:hypothetical protein [Paenibacillus beijingensis]|uniref:Uncharacterized protein n=1 Tax=Paenibacillus beijingensis TaxID=1126833 RepID=A0A0D5NLS8_9BACL|nr:hypothetical protein [Paenibacillus beijingensis]AJY76279.1 hypothetical protein VN24_19085 [Paenibacillus beijingensis]
MNQTTNGTKQRHYVESVLNSIINMGYDNETAKKMFLDNYRIVKRRYGFGPNAENFAKEIIDLDTISKIKYDPNNPDMIDLRKIRKRIKETKKYGKDHS